MITKIFKMDLISSKIESLEKILLNPLIGLNLSNFGCKGLPVTFQPTCITLIKAVTIKPNAKKGAQVIKICISTSDSSDETDLAVTSTAFSFTKSGIRP